MRTFCIGSPPWELTGLQDGYMAALDKLLEIIRPGVKSSELLSSVEETYNQWGVRSYWNNSIGHGVGITVHEPPRIASGSEAILSEGMILAIEPYLVSRDIGGYAQCDLIAVKETGPEILAQGPQGLMIVAKD
jgi:Xaa-Pro aminopeptidase